jgi:hypothetical protein
VSQQSVVADVDVMVMAVAVCRLIINALLPRLCIGGLVQ